jgi:hypothetical protein
MDPMSRVRDIFAVGLDRSSSPPFVRCPRHLRRACEICVTPGRTAPPRTSSDHRANEWAPVAQGLSISGFSEGAGVGSGLAWPGLGGSLLRRGIPPPDEAHSPPGAKNTQLVELIPRFLRLSALVALELGREVGTAASAEDIGAKALVPTAEWYLLLAGLLTCAVLEGYLTAGWAGLAPVQVLLGVGLGSAVIPEASLLITNDEYDEFEPDGMPDLPNAVNVLFPSRSVNTSPSENEYYIATGASGGSNFPDSGGSGSGSGRQGSDQRVGDGGGEGVFSHEMGQRLARVCNCLLGSLSFTHTLLIGVFIGNWALIHPPSAPLTSFSTSLLGLLTSRRIWKTSRGGTPRSQSSAQRLGSARTSRAGGESPS